MRFVVDVSLDRNPREIPEEELDGIVSKIADAFMEAPMPTGATVGQVGETPTYWLRRLPKT